MTRGGERAEDGVRSRRRGNGRKKRKEMEKLKEEEKKEKGERKGLKRRSGQDEEYESKEIKIKEKEYLKGEKKGIDGGIRMTDK